MQALSSFQKKHEASRSYDAHCLSYQTHASPPPHRKHRWYAFFGEPQYDCKVLDVPTVTAYGWGMAFGVNKGGECGYIGDDFLVHIRRRTALDPNIPAGSWRKLRSVRDDQDSVLLYRWLFAGSVPSPEQGTTLPHGPENADHYDVWVRRKGGVLVFIFDFESPHKEEGTPELLTELQKAVLSCL